MGPLGIPRFTKVSKDQENKFPRICKDPHRSPGGTGFPAVRGGPVQVSKVALVPTVVALDWLLRAQLSGGTAPAGNPCRLQ